MVTRGVSLCMILDSICYCVISSTYELMRCEVYIQFGVTVICEALQFSSSADIIADLGETYHWTALEKPKSTVVIVDAKLFLDL